MTNSTFRDDGWNDALAGLSPSPLDIPVYAAEYMEGYNAFMAKHKVLRRIIACARRAMTAYGWSRRVAVKFAIGHYKAGTLSDSVSYTPKFKPRRDMSGETQNMLTHRRRSMAR